MPELRHSWHGVPNGVLSSILFFLRFLWQIIPDHNNMKDAEADVQMEMVMGMAMWMRLPC